MSRGYNSECVFASVFFPEAGKEDAGPPAHVAPVFPENATNDQVEAVMALEVCPRPNCRLKNGDLIGYHACARIDLIRQNVPSDCAWNDPGIQH